MGTGLVKFLWRFRTARRLVAVAAIVLSIHGLSGSAAGAADLRVQARVHPTEVNLGAEVQLTVEVIGDEAGESHPPDLIELDDFRVVSGPSTQTRYQWIDGNATHTRGFRYSLLPLRAGLLAIPPIPVRIGDRVLNTQMVRVQVTAGGGEPDGNGPGRPDKIRSLSLPDEEFSGDLVAVAEIDKNRVFVGEQVTLRFLIRSAREVQGLDLLAIPEFPGFWVEEIPDERERSARRVRRNGRSYIEYTVMKRALFPSRSGDLVIRPVTFEVTVQSRSTGTVQKNLFAPRQKIHRRTRRLTLEVLPLPEDSRPDGFRGAVGEYRLGVVADRHEVQVLDPVTLRITLQGKGNINTLEPPLLVPPADFKTYPPRIEEVQRVEKGQVGGSKIWEYVMVPRTVGEHTIPPIRYTFFDPRQNKYRTLKSAPVTVLARPGESFLAARETGEGHGPLMVRGQDIHHIKTLKGSYPAVSRPLIRHPITAFLFLIPIIGNGALFFTLNRKRHQESNIHRTRKRRAWKSARDRLEKTRERLDSRSATGEFFGAISRTLTGYLADKFDVTAAAMTREKLGILLGRAGIPAITCIQFQRCLDACDRARFGKPADPTPDRRAILEDAEKILILLEKAL